MKARALADSEELAFELALRIRHPSMDPEDLSRELDLEPTHTFRAGQLREPRSSASPASVHAESYWLGTLDPTAWLADIWPTGFATIDTGARKPVKAAPWQNLGSALDMTARVLVRSHVALFERIRSDGGQVCLLVTLSPIAVDSFSVAPEVCQIFGELGITIEFEMMSD
jgi:hypothetical protein